MDEKLSIRRDKKKIKIINKNKKKKNLINKIHRNNKRIKITIYTVI